MTSEAEFNAQACERINELSSTNRKLRAALSSAHDHASKIVNTLKDSTDEHQAAILMRDHIEHTLNNTIIDEIFGQQVAPISPVDFTT